MARISVVIDLEVADFKNRALDIQQLHDVVAQGIDVLEDEHGWSIRKNRITGSKFDLRADIDFS